MASSRGNWSGESETRIKVNDWYKGQAGRSHEEEQVVVTSGAQLPYYIVINLPIKVYQGAKGL